MQDADRFGGRRARGHDVVDHEHSLLEGVYRLDDLDAAGNVALPIGAGQADGVADQTAQPQGLNDWAAQLDLSHETIRWALEQAGAALDDVVRRRIFTVDGARVNRPYGEGPAWFAKSYPASLGCRIAGLARPELLVEVEVAAVKGAHAGIEWVAPDAVDALDLRPG